MTKKLKISKALSLRNEINELLSTKDVLLKMYLVKTFNTVNDVLQSFDVVQKEFLLENGTKREDGSYELKTKLENDEPNPKFKEYLALLDEEIELKIKPLPIKLFEKAGTSDIVFIELIDFIEF